ncbi:MULTISPECIES: NAD(P)-dependent oxidoreductase [unclassified Bacteroides]|uniref:NAD-dependent epimerase/dehydratase family protein n=1 Tax=unclassified Bacteroides TaxID=2646097 RepID=UPI0012DFC9C1|nr:MULTISPECIES: NAD(P)-dependent oxidoreductase [unclassified Bacteroides]
MIILVTGSAGMIGGYVVKGLIEKGHTVIGVDRVKPKVKFPGLTSVILDLSSKDDVMRVFSENKIDRCIHLAALAHTAGVKDVTWEAFKKVNVDMAENVFEACAKYDVPVLFISTVDAIGMVKGLITPDTELNPVSNYGKSKALAEGRLKEICKIWNIYRFSPVYTQDVKRDIEKRYYLKYPNFAYLIGGGQQFEVLDVTKAVASMVDWVDKKVDNTIHFIKDDELLDSAKVIAEESAEGRAKNVFRIPRWMVVCGYYCIKLVFGKSNKTYLVFKALWPFRTVSLN